MSEKPIKINVPKDPIVIGKTADGDPIWMEPKELIPTPAEDEERWSNTLDLRQQAMIDQAAQLVLKNACMFVEFTIVSVTPGFLDVPFTDIESFILSSDFSVIQDGLKTVVKRNGKVLREMTANVEHRWRSHVARRVNELVAGKALIQQRN